MESRLVIYNSLSRKKEEFIPLNPPFVGFYACGPTVYSEVHLGNLRSFTSFDMMYRYLLHCGYKVRYVRNITDAGHITTDSGEDMDRIGDRARLEQIEPMEVVQKYTVNFHEVCKLFNLLPPSIEPTATGHILEQIEMVQRIIDNGYGYVVNGSVYFDVRKYAEKYNYGKLSGRKIDEQLETTRDLDGQEEKKYFADFSIWKAVTPQHIQKWNSPWGEGVPGWHLECSVMSTKYLGKEFDIHAGGNDIKFPHHECEIAQSVGADGIDPVRYWVHTNMLTVNGEKMSKSKGNSFLPMELFAGTHPLLEKGYSPSVVRFFMMQTHYSSTLDFSNEALQAAEKGYARLSEAFKLVSEFDTTKFNNTDALSAIDEDIKNQIALLKVNMDDDFNTPKTIAVLFELASYIYKIKHENLSIHITTLESLQITFKVYFEDVLGLKIIDNADNSVTNGLMDLILEMRKEARTNKNWSTSDLIRDKLAALQIQVKDEKDGAVSWSQN
ncbi:MAG: cysteine--tRNA ligase [Bacteroidota bacterium]